MAPETLEDRLATVENELAQIKRQLAAERLSAERPQTGPAGWESIFGSFADSEGFDEAVRLGREWRAAQNAQDEATG